MRRESGKPTNLSNNPLRPGDHVGSYILRKAIGEGAFAQVWTAAHHERPGRVVALKMGTAPAFRRLTTPGALLRMLLLSPDSSARRKGADGLSRPVYAVCPIVVRR
jgi:hypothetical protein